MIDLLSIVRSLTMTVVFVCVYMFRIIAYHVDQVGKGHVADKEALLDMDIPGLNLPFATAFSHPAVMAATAARAVTVSNSLQPHYREYGVHGDTRVCYASPPAAGADVFADVFAGPLLSALM
jgi:hypothetical protein